MNQYQAFTFKSSSGKFNVLKTEVGVCQGHDPRSGPHPEVKQFIGIWDTGASGTMISAKIVAELGLVPTGKVKVFTASGANIVNTYFVNIFLPNQVAFSTIKVTEGVLNGADMLIGMDIITQGDFSISHFENKTCFSFRVPSVKETDFVQEHIDSTSTPVISQKVGRNSPCPCGSGKKYKQCHGK